MLASGIIAPSRKSDGTQRARTIEVAKLSISFNFLDWMRLSALNDTFLEHHWRGAITNKQTAGYQLFNLSRNGS